MSELQRATKKLLAIRRAQRRLQNRLDDIDWEIDELVPEVEQLKELASQGQLPTFELEKGDEGKD